MISLRHLWRCCSRSKRIHMTIMPNLASKAQVLLELTTSCGAKELQIHLLQRALASAGVVGALNQAGSFDDAANFLPPVIGPGRRLALCLPFVRSGLIASCRMHHRSQVRHGYYYYFSLMSGQTGLSRLCLGTPHTRLLACGALPA